MKTSMMGIVAALSLAAAVGFAEPENADGKSYALARLKVEVVAS